MQRKEKLLPINNCLLCKKSAGTERAYQLTRLGLIEVFGGCPTVEQHYCGFAKTKNQKRRVICEQSFLYADYISCAVN